MTKILKELSKNCIDERKCQMNEENFLLKWTVIFSVLNTLQNKNISICYTQT